MHIFHKNWFWFVVAVILILAAGIAVKFRGERTEDAGNIGDTFNIFYKAGYGPGDSKSLEENGKIVVGFKKGISQIEAESLLKKYGLKFLRTDDVNLGKKFFFESGEKFIVDVPEGQEQLWKDEFNKFPEVYRAMPRIDPAKAIID